MTSRAARRKNKKRLAEAVKASSHTEPPKISQRPLTGPHSASTARPTPERLQRGTWAEPQGMGMTVHAIQVVLASAAVAGGACAVAVQAAAEVAVRARPAVQVQIAQGGIAVDVGQPSLAMQVSLSGPRGPVGVREVFLDGSPAILQFESGNYAHDADLLDVSLVPDV